MISFQIVLNYHNVYLGRMLNVKLFTKKGKIMKVSKKETIDKVLFRTTSSRNWLVLELIAPEGMRIGEALKLRLKGIHESKLLIFSKNH